jgi:hypothetical protein
LNTTEKLGLSHAKQLKDKLHEHIEEVALRTDHDIASETELGSVMYARNAVNNNIQKQNIKPH